MQMSDLLVKRREKICSKPSVGMHGLGFFAHDSSRASGGFVTMTARTVEPSLLP